MAVQLPSGLYSGFTEVLDSRPTMNMVNQNRLRKQAKEDALDEYDKRRINNVNPTGVRDVDRQGFDQRLEKVQLFYNQNKDKIRKGGTPESYEYEKLFRDVGSYINESKERTAKQDAAMKLYQDRLKQDGRIPDDFIKELGINDEGIDKIITFDKVSGEPIRSSSFDLKKWLSQPKPFNQQTYLKNFSDIKRVAGKPRYENVEGNPLKQTEIIEEGFDEGGKQVIAARAADKYQNSYSFSENVKEAINDPISRKKLEDVFKNEYGTNPIQPEDYATAYTMELLQPKIAKTKVVDNKEEVMKRNQAFQKEMTQIRHQNSLQRLYVNASVQDRKPENVQRNIDGIITDHISSARGNNGQVFVDDDTFEAITGRKKGGSSVLLIDEQGNYTYGKKDSETGKIEISASVPYELAKTKLTKTYKSGLDSKFNTGGNAPTVTPPSNNNKRLPKDIKNTKIKVNW